MAVLSWYDTSLLTLLVLTTIGQCYVIWIVVKKSPKSMSEYRYFLCMCTAWDMLFTIVIGGLIHPDPIFPARAANIAGLGALLGGEVGARISICLAGQTGAAVVLSLDYCLIYRMVVILEDKRYHQLFVTKPAYVGFQSFGVCVSVVVGAILYLGLVTEKNNVMRLLGPYPESLSMLRPGLPVAAVDDEKTWVLIALSCIFFGLLLSEAVSFGVVYVILRTLRAHSASFSSKTYRMHLQLTVLLLVQLCSPIVFFIFPIVYAIYDVISGDRMSNTSGRIGFMMLSMYASLNSMLTLFFVTPYRHYTVERLRSFVRFLRRPLGGATSPLYVETERKNITTSSGPRSLS